MPSLSVSLSWGLAYSASRSCRAFHSGRVAHDHGVDHAKFVEGKLVLPQDAELLRPRDRTLRRLDLARQNLHQSGLAGAVRPGDRVAAPFEKRAGDVLEQDPARRSA